MLFVLCMGPPAGAEHIFAPESKERRRSLAYPVSYMLTAHLIGIIGLNAMDREDTGFSRPSARNFSQAWSEGPKFDDDEWYFNYLAHPLWGSETYLRARSEGFDSFGSFLFSTGSSVLWEFGFESWSVRPSIQDLLLTSSTGALIGEFRYKVKQHLMAAPEPNLYLVALIDPLQALSQSVGRVFGQDWTEPAYSVHAPRARLNLDVAILGEEPGLILHYRRKF